MKQPKQIGRRWFLQSSCVALVGAAGVRGGPLWPTESSASLPLEEFAYGDVTLAEGPQERQFQHTIAVLMKLSDDSLLKPMRKMAGQDAPGEELGGWYLYDPDYDKHKGDEGFAPGANLGQWISALARAYAITKDPQYRERVLRLNRLYAQTISPDFYVKNRFPAYSYDKIVCGLMDSHRYVGDDAAFSILARTTDTAMRHLPPKAVEHGTSWRPGTDITYTWDESYTMPENLFLLYKLGAGERYRSLAIQYLFDLYFAPLAEGRSVLNGRHAYSHVNALCSAMQAYLTLGDEKYFRAAKNGFDMVVAQSYATGGWGPDETLRAPESPDVATSLNKTHSSFETPCGSYAHFKLTRYLLRMTKDTRYGDSMERVMYNTILGAKPLQEDGRAFYYSDYNFEGHKSYHNGRWPCCSGTLPQIAADYRISAYFRDAQGIYVNLYVPSTVRWEMGGTEVGLTQSGSYPFDSLVQIEVGAARPAKFAVRLRIPAWVAKPSVAVNGKSVAEDVVPGTFFAIEREWRNGDRVELDLPMDMRLEALDRQHENLVALLRGPLVLFPIAKGPVTAKREQLLGATKSGAAEWTAQAANGNVKFLPFMKIEDETYSTYLQLE